jgi:hypothetical protein
MGNSHMFLADAGRPMGRNESEWQWICNTTIVRMPADRFPKIIAASTIRPLQEGHAYSLRELRELRNILRMQDDRDSDIEQLQCESDKFAFLVGWQVQGERQLSGKKRLEDVRKKLFQPAQALLEALSNREFVKEFSVPWGGFRGFDHAKFKQDLQTAVAAAKAHVAAIEKQMARGRAWDYGLKRLHVYMTACFCEHFNHSFEPKRLNSSVKEERHMFQEAVELLAKPLFESTGRTSGFSSAIREHVDGWNDAKNELFATGFLVEK